MRDHYKNYDFGIPIKEAKDEKDESVARFEKAFGSFEIQFFYNRELSLNKDIIPILIECYGGCVSDGSLHETMQNCVEQWLRNKRSNGYTIDCLPVFGTGEGGAVEIVDMVYRNSLR